ncbi:MAG: ABC transporter ATP-binding protein, partial [Chloroflexia bacterium]
ERLRKYTTIFYSTHILDDVQRVSDTVAILNHGKLIAEAPIGQLLAGGGGGSTIFTITLKGDLLEAEHMVQSLPWVKTLTPAAKDGATTWQVSVTDEAAAEAQLLRRVLADQRVTVTDFGRKTYDLEEVFLSLVEGSNKNGH